MNKLIAAFSLLALLIVPQLSLAQSGEGQTNSNCVYISSTPLHPTWYNPYVPQSTDANSGGQVSVLQDFLIGKGMLNYTGALGWYGKLTKDAVIAYQTSKGNIPTTGNVGPLTRDAIAAETGCTQAEIAAATGGQTMGPIAPSCPTGYMYSTTQGTCTVSCTTNPTNVSCTGPANPTGTATSQQTVNNLVIQKLATDFGLSTASITLIDSQPMTWNDGCLGIPPTAAMVYCTQALVPGYKVTLRANYITYIYHTNSTGSSIALYSSGLSVASPSITGSVSGLSANNSVAPGGTVNLNWQATNAPTGSAVGIWIVNAATGAVVEGAIGVAKPLSGNMQWNLPQTGSSVNCADCGGIQSTLPAGSYKAMFKVYTPSNAWLGNTYPPSNPTFPTHLATGYSASFTVSATQVSTTPTVTITSSSANSLNASYTNLPTNSYAVIVNKATGATTVSSGTYLSGSGTFQMNYTLSAGTYAIRILNNSTNALIAESGTFTVGSAATGPTIDPLSPSSGPTGTPITITGSGFSNILNTIYMDYTENGDRWYEIGNVGSSNGTSLRFTLPATYPCPTYRNGSIGCPAPTPITGSHTIAVKNSSGISGTRTFTVAGASQIPSINSIYPPTITAGMPSTVTLQGVRFNSTLMVGLTGPGADTSVNPTSVSADGTSLTFTFPASITSPGTYTIQLYNFGVAAYSTINLNVVSPTTCSYGQVITSSGCSMCPSTSTYSNGTCVPITNSYTCPNGTVVQVALGVPPYLYNETYCTTTVTPTISVTSSSGTTVSGSYANMPANSQMVIVNKGTGALANSGSSSGGAGSGSFTFSNLSLIPGTYAVRIVNYTNYTIGAVLAESKTFSIDYLTVNCPTGQTLVSGACVSLSASIDQSSLTQSQGSFSLTGSAANVTGVAVVLAPANYSAYGYTYAFLSDYNSITGQIPKDGFYLTSSVVSDGRWKVPFSFGVSGSYAVFVFDSSTKRLLTTGTLAINIPQTCLSGQTIVNGVCTTQNFTGYINLNTTTCSIPAEKSSCNVNLTWGVNNYSSATTLIMRDNTTSITSSVIGPVGSNYAVGLPQGTHNFVLKHNNSTVATSANVTASCATGTSWNGTSCATTTTVCPSGQTLSSGSCVNTTNPYTCSTGTVVYIPYNASPSNYSSYCPLIAPSITTTSLPNATVGVSYASTNATLSSSGGSESNRSWFVSSGALPPGVYLNIPTCTSLYCSQPASIGLAGVPTTAGTYSFQVTLNTVGMTVSKQFTIVVNPAPAAALGSYRIYYSGNETSEGGTNNISQADALANCMTNHNNNLGLNMRCTWNGTEIYTYTAPTCPSGQTFISGVCSPATATYMGYRPGNTTPTFTTANVTRESALSMCMTNSGAGIRCTWNGVEIFNNLPAVVTPTITSIDPSSAQGNAKFTIYGTGFSAFNTVFLDYISSTNSGTVVGSYTSAGTTIGAFTLPSGTSAGTHTLTVKNGTGGVSVPKQFTILAAPVVTPPSISVVANGITVKEGMIIDAPGGKASVVWEATGPGTISCTLNGSSFASSGSQNYTGLTPAAYTFACTNSYGTTVLRYSVNVPAVLGISTVCTNLTYNFHRGNESESTVKLQAFLQTKGLLMTASTGFYGDKTVAAVKAYQKSKGLPMTGMVYGMTRAAIKADTCQ
jgi:hypothetical protein